MKKYGIITAMQEEMQAIKNIMTEINEQKIYELNFIKGKINNIQVILVEAGVGKVNSARTTQILIDNFEVEAIINVGSAGSANDELNIGDIVRIEMPSFFSEGNYAVKEIEYTYKNKTEQNWKIVLKSSDLISTYIDMFRPQETEENEDKIDTVILGEFVEENIKEIHTVSIVEKESS